MGIPGLWKILEPASHSCTFTQLTITEGVESHRRSDGALYIGIDSSIWMNQAQTIMCSRNGPGTQAGENPVLRVLFFRLCRLLALSVVPIFVFDGNSRPSTKRGTRVVKSPHWISTYFQDLIGAFGFHWYTAPGEAEAELAQLNARYIIDAVLTDDVDTLVFGANAIIRTPNVKEDGDKITIYATNNIKNHPDVQLSQAGLFLMAVLVGGDYDSGLVGCGTTIAHQISGSNLAESLFIASKELSLPDLQSFLPGWREDLKTELNSDPRHAMGRKYPTLANAVDTAFPAAEILGLYAHPVTTWSDGGIGPDRSQWCLRQPNLPEIGFLCEKYFSWGSHDDLIPRFRSVVWPGVVIRYLLQHPDTDLQLSQHLSGSIKGGTVTDASILRIQRAKLGPGGPATGANTYGYSVQISTYTLIRDSVITALSPEAKTIILRRPRPVTFIWIPAAILQIALPQLVEAFCTLPKQRKKTHEVAHHKRILFSHNVARHAQAESMPSSSQHISKAKGYSYLGSSNNPINVDDPYPDCQRGLGNSSSQQLIAGEIIDLT